MGWNNPRWNSLTGPDADALRQIFESLSRFLGHPTFENGIDLGNGATPTYDPVTDVVVQPPSTPVDSDNVGIFTQDALQSDNYDGTDVATGDATAGWRLERDTGSIEVGDARIRGQIAANAFASRTDRSDFLDPALNELPNPTIPSLAPWSTPTAGVTLALSTPDPVMALRNSISITNASGATTDIDLRHDPIPISPGFAYSWFSNVRKDTVGTANVRGRNFIEWYDAGGNFIQRDMTVEGVLSEYASTDYTGALSTVAPVGAVAARPGIRLYDVPNGNVYRFFGHDGTSLSIGAWFGPISVIQGPFFNDSLGIRVGLSTDRYVEVTPSRVYSSVEGDNADAQYHAIDGDSQVAWSTKVDGSSRYGRMALNSYGMSTSGDRAVSRDIAWIYLDGESHDAARKSRITLDANDIQLNATAVTIGGDDIAGDWNNGPMTWTASGSAPSLANGSCHAFWKKIGKLLFVRLVWYPGAGTNFGTGQYGFSLPSGITTNSLLEQRLPGMCWKGGVGMIPAYFNIGASSGAGNIWCGTGVLNVMQHNSPYTWAAGDNFVVQGVIHTA